MKIDIEAHFGSEERAADLLCEVVNTITADKYLTYLSISSNLG